MEIGFMLNKARERTSQVGSFTLNKALCLSLTKYSIHVFKLTLVVQFYCDRFNPWLQLPQSRAHLTVKLL